MNKMENPFSALEAALIDPVEDLSTLRLPDPSLLAYYQCHQQRKVYFSFEVDDEALAIARDILMWNQEDSGKPVEQREPIWLYLFNYGGSADLMWALIDAIRTSLTPVYTVNLGKCDSAAALIFMAGHHRYMMPSATLTIHEGSGQIGGDAVKVLDQAESYKAMIKKMRDYILGVTKIPPAQLMKKKNNDWELTSTKCLEFGVCDEIIKTLDDII